MPMTVVVTSNVIPRFRGFLTSCMLEVAPGVYLSPKMNAGVRQRIWSVCNEWFADNGESSILMCWQDSNAPGGVGLNSLGITKKTLREHEGIVLVSRALSEKDRADLEH